jgi:hypothetical protein
MPDLYDGVTDEEVLEMMVIQDAYPLQMTQSAIEKRVAEIVASFGSIAEAVAFAHGYMSEKPSIN